MAERTLARRGTEAQTRLAHEFGLHEYIWPKACGHERWKWERAVEFIDKAAQNQHRRTCSEIQADGRTRLKSPRYERDHAEMHRSSIRSALVDMMDAGIPKWLTERDSPLPAPVSRTSEYAP